MISPLPADLAPVSAAGTSRLKTDRGL
jgi:hypothetical protein